jgi:hypothetical protein
VAKDGLTVRSRDVVATSQIRIEPSVAPPATQRPSSDAATLVIFAGDSP